MGNPSLEKSYNIGQAETAEKYTIRMEKQTSSLDTRLVDLEHYFDCSTKCYYSSYRVFIKYCVFSKILKYIPDSGLSRCVLWTWTTKGRTPALRQNWQSWERSQHLKEKNTIFNEHPVVENVVKNSNPTYAAGLLFLPLIMDIRKNGRRKDGQNIF